jgi:3-dehydroquinate synthetase
LITFAHGEASKNLGTIAELSSILARRGFDRKDGLLALGGGVTGDIAGFLASCYMRSIPFAQVPTTLLAQVDSSVGGKTGVDIPEGKNLVGAFYQPRAVFIDSKALSSLPAGELLNGLAEVIKYGVIYDRDFFKFLELSQKDILAVNLPGAVRSRLLLSRLMKQSPTCVASLISAIPSAMLLKLFQATGCHTEWLLPWAWLPRQNSQS